MSHGYVILNKCGVHRNVVRCLAPLVTDNETVDQAIAVFDKSIAKAINT